MSTTRTRARKTAPKARRLGGGIKISTRNGVSQTETQLAGCAVAALGGGKVAKKGDYGWSHAYQDVLDLRAKYEEAIAERAALWALLDDIDTLDDSARGDDKGFRNTARMFQKMRHHFKISDREIEIGHSLLSKVSKRRAKTKAKKKPRKSTAKRSAKR